MLQHLPTDHGIEVGIGKIPGLRNILLHQAGVSTVFGLFEFFRQQIKTVKLGLLVFWPPAFPVSGQALSPTAGIEHLAFTRGQGHCQGSALIAMARQSQAVFTV